MQILLLPFYLLQHHTKAIPAQALFHIYNNFEAGRLLSQLYTHILIHCYFYLSTHIIQIEKPQEPEEVYEEAIVLKPKKKVEPEVIEEVETKITLKPKKQPEPEEVEEQLTLPKKKKKPQVVQEETTEFTITKEVGKNLSKNSNKIQNKPF